MRSIPVKDLKNALVNHSIRICSYFLPDSVCVQMKFHLRLGKHLNLENPVTFSEKIQWLKLYDHNPEYTTMTDKYEVKKYISETIGEEYVIPLLGVYDNFDDIDFSKLPNQFVIKCTHDSGGLVICRDKNKLDFAAAKKKIEKSLRRNYYRFNLEWAYKNIKPRIIIEQYMEDANTAELNDYKIMCFNGKAKCSFTCTDRYSDGLKVTFFDLKWHKMPFERHYPASKDKIPKPRNYQKMIELSEKLAKDIPFVRVDWYEINGKLYFGELTFYPGSGMEEFTPEEWDSKIGEWIQLPAKNNES